MTPIVVKKATLKAIVEIITMASRIYPAPLRMRIVIPYLASEKAALHWSRFQLPIVYRLYR